ncbi:MAG: DNA methylase [Deltaproteobacteria bacterium]|nr:MAG: DNA methylase [Deltaproteobacteria bacterium]
MPDEPLPPKDSHRAVGSQLPLYNFKVWADLFNCRQKLAMLTLVDKVRQIQLEMQNRGINREYIKTVASYLGLTVDMTGAFCNTLARWENTSEAIKHLYSRQALPMMWDYVESCPFSESTGSLEAGWEYYLKAIEHCSLSSENCGYIYNASATQLEYENDTFDAVFTDPPYYDNVPYSYLSDLFYVWLKRSLGHLFPELFSTPLSPKKNEIVVYANKPGIKKQATEFFEGMLKKSFQEIHRILKPGGVTIIVYAHKSTQGWETLINSLLDSGLVITAAWPINTEMRSRILARETAALGSSIYIVARKMKREQTGFYQEVRQAIEEHLNKKLERLWQEGIGGADFFISAIGSAIEVFGKYEKVMDYEGNIVRADRLLEDVRKIATEFAVRQILHNGFTGEISDLTRFYVLYRWNYGHAKVHFDEARKLAASCGIDIAREWNHGFISKQKEFIRVLGPSERNASELKNPEELIDVLHAVLRYWEKGKRSEMVELLTTSGFGRSEAFYRVAQAIAETLPDESKEKKLLDGFLAGRERLKDEITSLHEQASVPKQESFL